MKKDSKILLTIYIIGFIALIISVGFLIIDIQKNPYTDELIEEGEVTGLQYNSNIIYDDYIVELNNTKEFGISREEYYKIDINDYIKIYRRVWWSGKTEIYVVII